MEKDERVSVLAYGRDHEWCGKDAGFGHGAQADLAVECGGDGRGGGGQSQLVCRRARNVGKGEKRDGRARRIWPLPTG